MRLTIGFARCFLSTAFLLSIIACEIDVPVKEMSLAKMTITRAGEVKADKYAPEEFKKAKEYLYKTHEDIKNNDAKKAGENAAKSYKFAGEAVEKSLLKLSGDTLEEAKELNKKVNQIYDKKYSSEDISGYIGRINEAEKLHSDAKYWDSYLISKEVVKSLNESIQRIEDELKRAAKDRIEAAENSLKKVRASDKKGVYKAEIGKAVPLIERAVKLNNDKSYKESIAKSEEALGILNKITIAIEKKSEKKRIEKRSEEIKKKKLRYYTVQYNPKKRDCLWRIAKKMYNNPRLWPLIYMANRDKIKDPDLIFPGQKLVIPPIPSKKAGKGKKKDNKDKEAKKEEGADDVKGNEKDKDIKKENEKGNNKPE